MAQFVGRVGTTRHYADTDFRTWNTYGMHIKVTLWTSVPPTVTCSPLGKVRSREEAVDRVAAIVERERALLRIRDEDD